MAIWQAHFFIIPKKYEYELDNVQSSDEYLYDESIFWDKEVIDAGIFKPINNILPEKKSWSKNLILYGDENSNTLDILVSDNAVKAASLRVDFTSDYEHIVRGVIEFCIANAFVVFDLDFKVVPLNFEQMKVAIEKDRNVKTYNELLEGQKEKNKHNDNSY